MNYALIVDGSPVYPYAKEMLGSSYPNTSFPEIISDALAESFGCYAVFSTEKPQYDPRTQIVVEGAPSLSDGRWEQTWTVRNATAEEIEAYDKENSPAPEWGRFKSTLLTDETINQKLIEAITLAPVAAVSIVPSLMNAESGKFSDFAAAWMALRQKGAITEEMAISVLGLASSCNLPKDFLDTIS